LALNNEHIGIISQVRMTSTRLPGKVLMKINDRSLLEYHLDRLRKTGFRIIIATTINSADDAVCELAEDMEMDFYRGSELNVLERFYNAAKTFELQHIIRVTSDCPLIDPVLIRNGAEQYLNGNDENVYLSNSIERTYARGFDFEIFSFASLKEAYENTKDQSDIEHVTPFIWKNKSGKIKIRHFKQETDNSNLRVTVDTPEDLELIRQLIVNYKAERLSFSEIEKVLLEHPELVAINAEIQQKKVN